MSQVATTATNEPKKSGAGSWIKRILLGLLILLLVLIAVVIGFVLYFNIPGNGSAMAAKSICSAAFVADRDPQTNDLMAQDVLPASPLLGAISTDINEAEKTVTAKFLGMFSRQASLLTDRGCVLGEKPDPGVAAFVTPPVDPATWPSGDAAVPPEQWPAGVDRQGLADVVDAAFVGSGDPLLANARGVAVVQDGQLLIQRDGTDIEPNTPLHGWSMTKTVAAMLAYKKFEEVGLDIETPVVDAFPEGREPSWVGQWRTDDRAQITVADLFYMRPGLANDEGYEPWDPVVQMLYGEPNMAEWAASFPTDHEPGTYWEYLSATSNILAAVVQGQFPTDEEYWQYWQSDLFSPLGVETATLETDTAGTWVGSSYLWASAGDWARFGQLMLQDGQWDGEQLLPAGWTDLATTSALPDGEGAGYGAQTWLPANPVGGECKDTPGLPEDTMSMEGHWGQIVAMVPSRNAVIVRLGWTFNSDQFDGCQFVSDVLATLAE